MTTKTVWLSDVKGNDNKSFSINADLKGEQFLSYQEKKYLQPKVRSGDITENEYETYHKKLDSNIEIAHKIRAHLPIPNEILPQQAFFEDEALEKTELPKIFTIMSGYLVIHESIAKIFNQHNIGQTQLSKIKIYSHDGTQCLYDEHYFVNITEKKQFFLPNRSKGNVQRISGSQYSKGGITTFAISDQAWNCDIDLWHDTFLINSVFLSEPLYRALELRNLTTDFEFRYSCEII